MTDKSIIILGGLGYWGRNLVRCFNSLANVFVVDPTHDNPHHRSLEALMATVAGQPDGVVIATPPETHAALADKAGVMFPTAKLLIEKPMVTSEDEVALLAPYQDRIMVDHTFLYVPEFEYIKDKLDSGELGDPLYAYSDRLNLGKFQPCGVGWDLAPHDLALFQWLFRKGPRVIGSLPASIRYTHPDVVRMDLAYGDTLTHLHMSWIHPTKVRRTTIVCRSGMIVYDMLADEKVKIYYPGKEVGQRDITGSYGEYLMHYRGGDIVSPAVPQHEPLMAMCKEFISFCDGGTTRSGYDLGADVVSALCLMEKD
jgi:predicted dehydrogenase